MTRTEELSRLEELAIVAAASQCFVTSIPERYVLTMKTARPVLEALLNFVDELKERQQELRQVLEK